jgi:peptidyl-prolyl cis-trans isomerase D
VQRKYEENSQQYSTPEQVRASHILLKTEGKDDAAVKKRAEELLAKAKAGADFAKLAAQHTEEDAGKARGGDLDFFGRGQMVPEFDTVAFSLPPGQISDVVKTQFGYHIIKVTDKRAATTRKIDEVRPQIEEQIKWERAQAEAERIANELEPRIKKPEDLEAVAKPRGLTVAETPPFSREEPIAGLGMAPGVSDQAFELADGEVSGAIRTPQGFVFITVTGREAARDATLEEVKARVREDVIKQKAIDAARQKASAAAAQLKEGANFDAAAKAAGLEAKTTDLIARGAPVADAGASPALDAAAFALPAGGVSDPIVTDNGAVVVKVLEKKEVTPTELASGKQAVRDEMVNERRNRFYSAYMTKARDKMQININRETLAQLL